MVKLCPKCNEREKSVSSTGTVQPYCKECTAEYNHTRLAKKREFIQNYKLERGCRFCGYNAHPVALELNHIDPSTKKYNISKQLISISMPKLLEELEKCEVLCANCHQIHTHENGHHLS